MGTAIFLALLAPVWHEPDPIDSLKLYTGYGLGQRVHLSTLLGAVDMVCAVGRHENFNRYAMVMKPEETAAAEASLRAQNGGNQSEFKTFLIGFSNDKIRSVYASNLFVSQGFCVEGDGYIVFKKRDDAIFLGFEGAPANVVID